MDLFTINLPKREQLRLFCKSKGYIKTSDVIRWGSENFFDRAEREARSLAEEGFLVRMTEEEKIFRGFRTKEGVWVYVGN